MSKLEVVANYEVHHAGWDIPTQVILDTNGHLWMDNAHGSSDGFDGKEDKGHYTKWLASYQGTSDEEFQYLAQQIRKHFHMKPQVPYWIVAALNCGWTPPSNFNRDDYDWP